MTDVKKKQKKKERKEIQNEGSISQGGFNKLVENLIRDEIHFTSDIHPGAAEWLAQISAIWPASCSSYLCSPNLDTILFPATQEQSA